MTNLGLLTGGVMRMEFAGLLVLLNPELFREYQREKFHAGTRAGGGAGEGFVPYRQEITLPRGRA